MELTLPYDIRIKNQTPDSFYTKEELDLLHQLENGLIETQTHEQVMENLRRKLNLTNK